MGIMLVFSVLIRVRVQDLKRGVWESGFRGREVENLVVASLRSGSFRGIKRLQGWDEGRCGSPQIRVFF